MQIGPAWARVSPECKSFLQKLLTLDPTKRITAEKAMHDCWILGAGTLPKDENNVLALKNLKNFKTHMNFQKAVIAYIASQHTSAEDEERIRFQFQSIDKDKNGMISKEELAAVFQRQGVKSNRAQQEAEKILLNVDINHNGSIDYNGKFNMFFFLRVSNG